jgi:hypothetical protein
MARELIDPSGNGADQVLGGVELAQTIFLGPAYCFIAHRAWLAGLFSLLSNLITFAVAEYGSMALAAEWPFVAVWSTGMIVSGWVSLRMIAECYERRGWRVRTADAG